ncbi:DUF3505 multi-domain protein [Curvularia clavata]|uniref:DUF3505 multi-domain protein n=1 Tax=Curvularia clavata TaxID=95742 RepID=A0A9Q8ZCS5_CURCL|nr:DUF3505 multi-domain protein [Curvularia clavata]
MPPRRDTANLYQTILDRKQRLQAEQDAMAAQSTIQEPTASRVREDLLHARLPPGEKSRYLPQSSSSQDSGLIAACKALRKAIRKVFRLCRSRVIGRPALEIIQRRETGAETNEKPLYVSHQARTIKLYSGHVIKILCYIWRTSNNPDSALYKLRDEPSLLLDKIRTSTVASTENSVVSEDLERLCAQFWTSLLHRPLSDDEYQSPLLSGVAVLALRDDHLGGGWHSAANFSPILSALITTSKMLFLYDT